MNPGLHSYLLSMKQYLLITVAMLLLLCLANPLFADQELLNLVTEKKLQEKIKILEEGKDLDEELKSRILGNYKVTLNYLDEMKVTDKQIDFYKSSLVNTPKKIKLYEQKLKKLLKKSAAIKEPEAQEIIESIKKTSLENLEEESVAQSIKLVSLSLKHSELSQSLKNESNSLPQIRKELIEANNILEKLLEDRQVIPDDHSIAHKQSIQWRIDVHIELLRKQIKMWDKQLQSQPVRLKLLKISNEISELEVNNAQEKLDVLQKKIEIKRSQEIKKNQLAIKKEQQDAHGKHPLIQSLVSFNSALNEKINAKTKKLSFLESRDEEIYKAIKQLKQEQTNTRKKLDIAGLNQILGQVLYEQKKSLPDIKRYKKELKKRQNLISKSGLEHLQYQEELRKIKKQKEYLAALLKDIPQQVRKKIYNDVKQLILSRKSLLEKAINIDEKYLKAIGEIDFAQRQYIIVVSRYSEFLNEHLFWLRSAAFLNISDLKKIPDQVGYFLSPSKWLRFVHDFIAMMSTSFYIFPLLLTISFFLFKRKRLHELLINTGLKTRRISKDSLLHTFKALFYTLLMATPLPVLLYIISWQLMTMPEAAEFTDAVALGMQFIVLPLFWLQTFRYMCFPGGLAEVHFKWPASMNNGLRMEMWRLMITFLPILFITALLVSRGDTSVNSALGRVSLFLTLFTFFIFYYRLLKPKTGLLYPIAEKNPHRFYARYNTLLFVLGLLSISALIVLNFIGYVYTAGHMTASLIYTLWLIFAMVILQQISVRWLLITQRRYALSRAYEKRKALQKKNNPDPDAEDDSSEHLNDFDEPEIDIVSLSEESSKLLNLVLFILAIVGISAIWSDVLPALGIFGKIVLWHHTGIVDGAEKILPITLWDVSLAAFILLMTLVSARRLPAIIEILLIQSSSISSGSRYTITTLVNYTIIGLGFFTIFHMLGAEWAKLQWLFAALSVGIGFGLQEIVANFISGIIILFERPIRVGDYVSVGDNEGIVSKIKIRATTILTRDRKELLVPNKEFITGQLLNWSLSDPTARLIIPVGVAYGSDVPLARKLLIEAAQENERVLSEPAPQVLFYNFGDNTLDLQLRLFIGDVDYRLRTISEINELINQKFTAAGINIAFPQRDVHLDIQHPLEIVLHNKDL